MEKKIAVIGCGNLGLSIINGLLNTGVDPNHITATRRNLGALQEIAEKGIQVSDNNIEAVNTSEIIIVAVKPYNCLDVIQELREAIDPKKHILVSLATAISLSQIETIIPEDIPIFREMPNTASDVGNSMTCICTHSKNENSISYVKQCFNSIGETVFINESLMDAATVIGACGIAYVLRFIRAMVQGGIQIGFDSKTASTIVNQTVKGAAELLIEGNHHPEYEIDKVTTPKGCTIAGLNEMEHNGFSSALIKGIVTSFEAID